jgi:hypothetical protein
MQAADMHNRKRIVHERSGIWMSFQNGRSLSLDIKPEKKRKDRTAASLNAGTTCQYSAGPNFFSSIQSLARAVSGTLHETVSDYIINNLSLAAFDGPCQAVLQARLAWATVCLAYAASKCI